ncbi:hemolysin family protein [Mycoplasma marinum]|uniref:Hemolysin C n=1 Tax=Mycoplasma marinum TaxID=1937190 RepID=A0A4V2NI06_9MOLU|nr:hemolysin family protein [Mycoplasma marinum]TCG10948.1 hemolysin C [Mycoplasma marinum]
MNDSIIIGLIVLLIILILLSSMFSAAETAYTSVNSAKISMEVKKKTRAGKVLKKHLKSFGWTLSTILIGNNIVNIGSSVLISYLFTQQFSPGTATILSIAVMTPIIVVFGEIIPKILAKKYSFGYLKKICFVMELLNYLFYPFTYPISKINISSEVTNTENELKQLLDTGRQEGVIEKREATLASNALDLDSTKVSAAFTRRKQVVFITDKTSLEEAKDIFDYTGYSRLPLIKNKKWIGTVHLKDIIFMSEGQPEEMVSEVPFVSKNMILTNVLETMRLKKTHIAFVTDVSKSQKVIGIITLEDIIEELLGEIYDEHDVTDTVRQLGLYKWVAEGQDHMTKISEITGFVFNDVEQEQTLKQWLKKRLNRHIKEGLIYVHRKKIRIKVISNKKGQPTLFEIAEK